MSYRNSNNKIFQSCKNYHILIFQHFTVNELVKLTEANSEFNNIVSNCRHCMCQIAVHLTIDKYNDLREMDSIIKSRRRYLNFKLTCGYQENLSELFLDTLSIFYQSIIGIDANAVMLSTNQYNLKLPKLKFLKVSLSNLNALNVLLDASENYQLLQLENFSEPITDHRYIDQIMRFRNVRMINIQHMTALKNLDFLYSNCVDFQFESNRKSDYECLASILNVIKCRELKIQWIKRGHNGYRLTLNRLTRIDEISIPIVDLYHRRTFSYQKNDASYLPPEYFLVLLEISELSWSFMTKIGRIMTELEKLTIFDLSDREKKNFFLTFRNLNKIITINNLNVEVTTERSSMSQKVNSIDPLYRISSKNLELMFSHFTIDDFQNAADVSGSWNNIVSKSPHFMKFIKIRLVNIKQRQADDIINFQKHFQNIEISSSNHVFNILNCYSNFIVELFLHDIQAVKAEKFFMPKLEILTLSSVSDVICGSILDGCRTLKALKFQNMFFNEQFIYRLKNQEKLERLHFVDVDMIKLKNVTEKIELKLRNIQHFEVSYSKVRLSKNIYSMESMVKFMKDSSFENISSITLCRIDGSVCSRMLKHCQNLKKIELRNFFWNDMNYIDKYNYPVEIYVQNNHYLKGFNWKYHFPNYQSIHVGRSIFNNSKHIVDTHRNFISMLGTSGKKMIKNSTFNIENSSLDPLIHIHQDVHDLVFQHFKYDDAISSLEVSTRWNAFCKDSRTLMDHILLKLPPIDVNAHREVLRKSSRNYQNIYISVNYFTSLIKFCENLRHLTILCNGEDIKNNTSNKTFNFPYLETLTIRRHRPKIDRQYSVKNLLSFFTTCRKLKSLIIYEVIDPSAAQDFGKILRNNSDLKELIVMTLKSIEFDWMDGTKCQVEKLTIGIDDKNAQNVEMRMLDFLKLHRDTCKELLLSHCSATMMHEVFGNYNKIHTFCAINGYKPEARNLPVNLSIENCILPFDLPADLVPYFIDRLPNVRKLFVPNINGSLAAPFANNLMFLKTVSYYTDIDGCCTRYERMIADRPDRKIKFNRLGGITFEKINVEDVFKENGPFRRIEPLPNRYDEYGRRRGGRYEDSDEFDDEAFERYRD